MFFNMATKHILLFIFIISLLQGCVSGPQYKAAIKPKSDESSLYIYRVWKFAGGGKMPRIYINGKRTMILKNGTYANFKLPPGEYSLKAMAGDFLMETSREEGNLKIQLKPGQTHYVEWGTDLQAIYGTVYAEFDNHFMEVQKLDAIKRIKDTNHADKDAIEK
jgi:hypothetical protein